MTKKITTFFTDSGVPKTGLSATIRIRDLSTSSLVITDAAMTEVGDGFYSYDFTSYDEDADYSIRCDGSATLTNNVERYTYAGNESYVDDIWDAQVTDHQVAGSMGYEIRGSGGVIIGNNGTARRITKAESEAIAKAVWEVMLTNEQNAKEVLLSRSSFDAIKEKVFTDPIKLIDNTVELKRISGAVDSLSTLVSNISSEIRNIDVNKPVDFTPVIEKISSVAVTVKEVQKNIDSIVPVVEESIAKASKEVTDHVLSGTDIVVSSINDGHKDIANMDLNMSYTISEQTTSMEQIMSSMGEFDMSIKNLTDAINAMAGDVTQKRMLKKTLLEINAIKFRQLKK